MIVHEIIFAPVIKLNAHNDNSDFYLDGTKLRRLSGLSDLQIPKVEVVTSRSSLIESLHMIVKARANAVDSYN